MKDGRNGGHAIDMRDVCRPLHVYGGSEDRWGATARRPRPVRDVPVPTPALSRRDVRRSNEDGRAPLKLSSSRLVVWRMTTQVSHAINGELARHHPSARLPAAGIAALVSWGSVLRHEPGSAGDGPADMRPSHDTRSRPPVGSIRCSRRKTAEGKFGWGTWIRTKIDGVRVRSSTVELSPSGPSVERPSPMGTRLTDHRTGFKPFECILWTVLVRRRIPSEWHLAPRRSRPLAGSGRCRLRPRNGPIRLVSAGMPGGGACQPSKRW